MKLNFDNCSQHFPGFSRRSQETDDYAVATLKIDTYQLADCIFNLFLKAKQAKENHSRPTF